MKKHRIAVLLCAAVHVATPASAEVTGYERYSFGGYFKSFAYSVMAPGIPGITADETFSALLSRLRFKGAVDLSPAVTFNAAYSISPRLQDTALFLRSSDASQEDAGGRYRVADLPRFAYGPESNFRAAQNLDRLSLKIAGASSDITVGRQAVAWGSARAVNPTDILAPFRYDELDSEERSGVDAARWRITTGWMSEIDVGAVFGEKFQASDSAFYVRNKWRVHSADVSLILMDFKDNGMAGFDMASTVGGAGVWGEAAYVAPHLFGAAASEAHADYCRITAGADYSFSGALYGYAEYHYNGPGAASPDSYAAVSAGPAYVDGADFLLGRHYVIPGIVWQVTPLVTASGAVIVNCGDWSAYISPQVDYGISQNVYLSAGLQAGLGRAPELGPVPGTTRILSEFGGSARLVYAALRFYF